MAEQLTNCKCPACTAPLHYGTSGKMECDFCGGTFDVAEIEAINKAAQEAAAQAFEKSEEAAAAEREEYAQAAENGWDMSGLDNQISENDGMKVYNCPSCGADLIFEETTAATSCPYCNNQTIVPGQLTGAMKPEFIIPFKLTKEQAIAKLSEFYGHKFLLPKKFTQSNRINEIKGVYVPFWLFDCDADADCTFDATKSHSRNVGDYRETTTEHYTARRSGSMSFYSIPADGSSKMPDDYMDSIEPYNYDELVDFKTSYLAGYMADKYDVSADEVAERADKRCRNSAIEVMREDVSGYNSVTTKNANVTLQRGKVKYCLLPVWTLVTTYEDKKYFFTMNGQTGKMVGELPMDKGKYWVTFGVLSIVLTAIFYLLIGGM